MDSSIRRLNRRVNRLDDTIRHERFKVPFHKLNPEKTTVYKVTWETTKVDDPDSCQQWRYRYHTARDVDWLYIKEGDEELPLYYADGIPAYIIRSPDDGTEIPTNLALYKEGSNETLDYTSDSIEMRNNIDVRHEWASDNAATIDRLTNIKRNLPAATYKWTVQTDDGTIGYVYINVSNNETELYVPLVTAWYPTTVPIPDEPSPPTLTDAAFIICDEAGTAIDPQPPTLPSLTSVPYGVPLKVPRVITCKPKSLSVYTTDRLNLCNIVDATTDGFIYTTVHSTDPNVRIFSQAPLIVSLTTGPSFVDINDKRHHMEHGQGIVFGTYNQYPFGWMNYGGTLLNINQHTLTTSTEFGPGFQYVISYGEHENEHIITDDTTTRCHRLFYILEKDVNNQPPYYGTDREPFLLFTPFHDSPCEICHCSHSSINAPPCGPCCRPNHC